MKSKVFTSLLFAGVQSAAAFGAGPTQFTSRVYFVIHESSPYLVQRGRRVIETEFAETYEGVPQLTGRPYQVVSDGNQVVFSMVADADMRGPFQNVVAEIVGQLNGRVGTQGLYEVSRTTMDETNQEKYLEVILDDTNTKIRSIVARAITVRDLLAELKLQFGDDPVEAKLPARKAAPRPTAPRFSYMIPRDCAARSIDWSFGTRPADAPQSAPGPQAKATLVAGTEKPLVPKEVAAKSLDEAMTELAKFFRLTVENHQGTYMFSGDCPRPTVARHRGGLEFLPSRWIQLGDAPSPSRSAPLSRPIEAPMVQVRMTE